MSASPSLIWRHSRVEAQELIGVQRLLFLPVVPDLMTSAVAFQGKAGLAGVPNVCWGQDWALEEKRSGYRSCGVPQWGPVSELIDPFRGQPNPSEVVSYFTAVVKIELLSQELVHLSSGAYRSAVPTPFSPTTSGLPPRPQAPFHGSLPAIRLAACPAPKDLLS